MAFSLPVCVPLVSAPVSMARASVAPGVRLQRVLFPDVAARVAMTQPDEIPDEAGALAWLPELGELPALDVAPALAAALASGEAPVALGETPVERNEAAVPGAKAPSWDEPLASAEAH